jgi:hypothetical protein
MSVERNKIDEKLAMLRSMIGPGIERFSLGLIHEAIRTLEAEKSIVVCDKINGDGTH